MKVWVTVGVELLWLLVTELVVSLVARASNGVDVIVEKGETSVGEQAARIANKTLHTDHCVNLWREGCVFISY